MYLISIEGEYFRISEKNIFFDIIHYLKKIKTNFSSNVIKKYIKFNKNHNIFLNTDDYIELLLLTHQYFKNDFEILCNKFDNYLKDFIIEHFNKISNIFDQISSNIYRYSYSYQKFLIKISKKMQNLNIEIINFLCGNLANYILVFAHDNLDVIENIDKYTKLKDNNGPYFLLKLDNKFRKIYANNKRQFILELYKNIELDMVPIKMITNIMIDGKSVEYISLFYFINLHKHYILPLFNKIFEKNYEINDFDDLYKKPEFLNFLKNDA